MDPSPTTPKRSRNLNRDQKLQVLTLNRAGYGRKHIAEQLGITPDQVRYTITKGYTSPKKNKGRIPKLTPTQVDELEEFVCSSRESRRMPYLELALNFPQWNVGEIAVRNALEGRGYSRCISRRKPPISEQNRRVRKSWAEAHRNMSVQDWSLVLWSDETWINDGPISPNFITRKKIKPGEEYDNECVSDKYRKSNSWMFWGCFSGSTKGPCVFWEKEWGNITAESYREHILPHVVERMRTGMEQAGRCLYFMQDNAPSHKAASNIEYLQNNGIQPIFWPAFSPDLNPIEAVWSMMKSFIQLRYPEFERSGQRPIGEVRSIIQDAWDSITSEQLYCLILSMPKRCQAVIDANGGPIGY